MSVVTLFKGSPESPGTSELLRDDKKVDLEVLTAGDSPVVGLYFSAHWCPPCKYVASLQAYEQCRAVIDMP